MLRISIIKRVMRMREALHLHPVTGEMHPDDRLWLQNDAPPSPIMIECPFCCAKPLKECTTKNGRKRKFHKQRCVPVRGRR